MLQKTISPMMAFGDDTIIEFIRGNWRVLI
jgi:hypothetical protein